MKSQEMTKLLGKLTGKKIVDEVCRDESIRKVMSKKNRSSMGIAEYQNVLKAFSEAMDNDIAEVKKLIEIYEIDFKYLILLRHPNPLIQAITNASIEKIVLLINEGINTNFWCQVTQKFPLDLCIDLGLHEAYYVLIEHGAVSGNIDLEREKYGKNPNYGSEAELIEILESSNEFIVKCNSQFRRVTGESGDRLEYIETKETCFGSRYLIGPRGGIYRYSSSGNKVYA